MDVGRDNGRVVDRDYEDKGPHPVHRTVHEAELALHEPRGDAGCRARHGAAG
ncbi:hypothetical protein RW1_024_00090 [Rhodococcus wratislaviensis NBRC 100605]|uniref:Uncharacterized protein n=1 Tax=Rhodococcus wratislaviensis NBRC 100605 TaxID=1219028 RepID=X0PRW0_RHOWR|nr:hypothetical protein RW1_024_00090 [Rhodococcus wratislaviensis NBRC 100605]